MPLEAGFVEEDSLVFLELLQQAIVFAPLKIKLKRCPNIKSDHLILHHRVQFYTR